jgi:anti-sigma regulatory factor (Ser/Thr protein kinase)
VSGIGEARRLAASVGRRAGLSAAESSDLGIVVTEIATNAVRHAGGGKILLRLLGGPGGGGVEMLCIDRGRGMASVSESSRDGHSTGGSMGTGLGAARRIAHVFDVYSQPGSGTVVLARMWAGGAGRGPGVAVASGVCLPMDGETKCGDAWRVVSAGRRSVVVVADGLGHGEGAFEASTAAMALFERHAQLRPTEILERIHAGLRSTRGAAVAVTEIDAGAGRVTYAGLGNIAARIITEDASRSLVSHHGIAGHEARKVQAFDYPWSPGATLIVQSDGIATQWKTESWPGILRRDPALLAGLLYRDFARPRDDSTVVVVRPSGARAPGGR